VLDIGGGPGRYSIELSRRGYDVTLADISISELQTAAAMAPTQDVELRHRALADARGMPFMAGAFDAVLMLGPLYHLQVEDDRRKAVEEAMRVLAPGGPVFAAFITRYAPLRYWAKADPVRISDNIAWWEERLLNGNFGDFEGFTDFYTARAEDVTPFMESCGVETIDLVGCEGVVSMIRDRLNELEGPAWDTWVDLNYRLGKDPSTHGCAEHLVHVGRAR
jgi:SAM-dependent methyltransferase